MLVVATAAAGCSKGSKGSTGGGPRPPSAFDQRWSALAQQGSQAFYIEDDRGEGLMGNVLRAQDGALAMAPALAQSYRGTAGNLPEAPDNEQVQRLIRQYLPGVKSCYMQISRAGDTRSGKAIVSFQIGGSGRVEGLNVDAPAFDGTKLSTCITGQISRWSFPPSRKGLAALSYPFVFVGG